MAEISLQPASEPFERRTLPEPIKTERPEDENDSGSETSEVDVAQDLAQLREYLSTEVLPALSRRGRETKDLQDNLAMLQMENTALTATNRSQKLMLEGHT